MNMDPANHPGKRLIFTAYITLKNGQKLFAWQKGLKAFPIWVDDKPKPKKKKAKKAN